MLPGGYLKSWLVLFHAADRRTGGDYTLTVLVSVTACVLTAKRLEDFYPPDTVFSVDLNPIGKGKQGKPDRHRNAGMKSA
jgi:hypothetical protein